MLWWENWGEASTELYWLLRGNLTEEINFALSPEYHDKPRDVEVASHAWWAAELVY